MRNDSKITNKIEELKLLETFIRDFQSVKSTYNYPDNPKFEKYNKLFNELIAEAEFLKKQGKIIESVRIYKKATRFSNIIKKLHESIEQRKKNPKYYRIRRSLWLVSFLMMISLFVVIVLDIYLELDLLWLINVFLISLLTIMVLGVKLLLKPGKDVSLINTSFIKGIV